MRIVVDASQGWMLVGGELVHDTLLVRSVPERWCVPVGTPQVVFESRDGWSFELCELCEADVACFSAVLQIDHEAATLVGRCPIHDLARCREAFIELLRTARPEWPDTLLVSELLALPALDT